MSKVIMKVPIIKQDKLIQENVIEQLAPLATVQLCEKKVINGPELEKEDKPSSPKAQDIASNSVIYDTEFH